MISTTKHVYDHFRETFSQLTADQQHLTQHGVECNMKAAWKIQLKGVCYEQSLEVEIYFTCCIKYDFFAAGTTSEAEVGLLGLYPGSSTRSDEW